jgi:hypothetical protein
MKAEIRKASDSSFTEIQEINTLDDLYELIKQYQKDLVISTAYSGFPSEGIDFDITIYDDYLE